MWKAINVTNNTKASAVITYIRHDIPDFENKKLDIIKIGYRFVFQANNRTLTDKEVSDIMESIINLSNEIDGIEIPGLN